MWAAQLDRPHIFVRPLDSIFLYIHPLLETKLCRNCVQVGASTCISIAADRSDDATTAEREIFPLRCGMNEEVVMPQYIFIQKRQLYYTECYRTCLA